LTDDDRPRYLRGRKRAPQSLTINVEHTVLITERDRAMLAFAAEHRFVIAAQPAALLEVSVAAAETRLRGLANGGYLSRQRKLAGEPSPYRITGEGLRAIGSSLPVPRPLNLALYDHDLGLGWLMVAARRGGYGPLGEVVSERRMRSDDGRSAAERATDGLLGTGRPHRHGVRLGGTGPGGRERLHYPDMVIVSGEGRRTAFELELTGKPRVRRETILAGYAADRRIDAVVYLVDKPRIGRDIAASATRIGIRELVRVERVTEYPARNHPRTPARTRAAALEREASR
jgi:hypothetical protein